MSGTTALSTDRYELTMVAAALHSGAAGRNAVFETFTRALPEGRRFGVVAGTGRLTDAVARFRFTDEQVAYLAAAGIVDDATCSFLADYRFRGEIHGYPEGEIYFAGSPVLTVVGTFAEAVVLETIVLSILNHDSAVATAAARMRLAAPTATLIEMGGRRTHEAAAVDAARAAYVGGFDATSNLEAGRRYGLPTAGTAAHAYVLAYDDELAGFLAQLNALGAETTLLVDTYDIEAGIRNAVAAARELGLPGPGAIRLDSGDLDVESRKARALLDELGATETRIVVSGDLDERGIASLERDPPGRAPIDAYGVGTAVSTGSGHPTSGLVHKLVEVDGREVSKRSVGKETSGGRKSAFRTRDERGVATAEVVTTGTTGVDRGRLLAVPLFGGGEPVDAGTLEDARARLSAALDELPAVGVDLADGPPALPTRIGGH